MSHGCHSSDSAIKCPQCSRHTVVSLNVNLWKCLNCDFSKDFSEDDEDEPDNTFISACLGGIAITLLCLLSL